MEELKLHKLKGYEARGNGSDRGPGYRIGVYKNYARAVKAASGRGWWGDGDVNDLVFYSDGETLYEVKLVGPFADEKEDYEAWMKDQIKEKLSPEEVSFLKL